MFTPQKFCSSIVFNFGCEGSQGVWCAVWNGEYENKGSRTDFEKDAQRLFENGEILFAIYFRGSAISAGITNDSR